MENKIDKYQKLYTELMNLSIKASVEGDTKNARFYLNQACNIRYSQNILKKVKGC